MAIILCDSNCGRCEASSKCPMKGEVRKKSRKDDPGSMPSSKFIDAHIQKMADQINSGWLIEKIGINLFNFTQYIGIMAENGDNLTENDIKREIQMASDDEEFFKILSQKQYSNSVVKKIRLIIDELAKKILQVSKKECAAHGCESCWMKESCVQIYTG